jgi:hypothetical protein
VYNLSWDPHGRCILGRREEIQQFFKPSQIGNPFQLFWSAAPDFGSWWPGADVIVEAPWFRTTL